MTPEIRERVTETLHISAAEYILAMRTWQGFGEALIDAIRGVDVLVTPTRSGTAPRMAAGGALVEPLAMDNYRGIFNLAGVPAMSIPCGFDD